MVEINVSFSVDIPEEILGLLSRFTNHIVSNWVVPGLSTSNLKWTIQPNSDPEIFDLIVNDNQYVLVSLQKDNIAQIADVQFKTMLHDASLRYGSR